MLKRIIRICFNEKIVLSHFLVLLESERNFLFKAQLFLKNVFYQFTSEITYYVKKQKLTKKPIMLLSFETCSCAMQSQ